MRRTEGATTALMAALGMPRVVGFAAPNDPAAREADTLEAAGIALALGVDVNAANADGVTALDAARRLGYASVTGFLIENGALGGEEAASR